MFRFFQHMRDHDFVILWLRVTAKLSKLQGKRLSPGSTCYVPIILVISSSDSADSHKIK